MLGHVDWTLLVRLFSETALIELYRWDFFGETFSERFFARTFFFANIFVCIKVFEKSDGEMILNKIGKIILLVLMQKHFVVLLLLSYNKSRISAGLKTGTQPQENDCS